MKDKLTMLMILDGFGDNPNKDGNAIKLAKTPNIDKLMKKYSNVDINTSGLAVGLPEGQMGNSEVGHTNIGAGRIIYQELTRITKEINEGGFFKNEALLKAMDYAAAGHQEETAALVAKQTALDQETVYEQRGDAEWLTGKQVSEGAADGTVEGYYELQKENFIAAGAVEVDPPVSDYVLLDVMKEAGEY